ncbi:hypothetical protein CERSUDRAFT_57200 [Gelatoporia subvermispora B]|uniref:Uncharacterized protein n=1 Tax=Ceriporiopsis subvermispora (strain B) TaxID=914234 RepID=M2Q9F6_CERS8|nr:hypothetical protein CERSUDRAFT_57200 [Gelatoporia subvermispora B]
MPSHEPPSEPDPAPLSQSGDCPDITSTATALATEPTAFESDPFYQVPEDHRLPTASQVHPHPAIFLLYLLVVWLHTQWHVPFRACNAILVVFSAILLSLGTPVNPPIFTSLPGIISALHVEPKFRTLPVCPSCMQVYPDTIPINALCDTCRLPLFVTEPTPAESRQGRTTRRVRKARLRFPFKSLETQLTAMLQVPGMETTCEQWRDKAREEGIWRDIFDGAIIRELKAPDGTPFFEAPKDDRKPADLRLGVTLGVDWFSYLRSQIAPSHTSCPMSFNVVNLPPALRYRTANLLLAGIMPGPKEANPDRVQNFLRVVVNELLRLWQHGFVVKTPKFPDGRLVRIILVGVLCDKPAAHKLSGFGSHSHTYFCTQDWITQSLKTSLEAFTRHAFASRSDTEHRRLMQRYKLLTSEAARDRFVKDHATRWSELARLPYFDMCRMVVVDPMHNIFLGLVKTHFYHIWVQGKVLRKTRELRAFHTMLADLEMPARLGRLPSLIGEPAGGSLTADQWLVLVTIVGPLLMPQIWHDYGVLDGGEAQQKRNEVLLQGRIAAIAKVLAERKQKKQKKKQTPKPTRKRPRTTGPSTQSQGIPRRSERVRRPTQRALEMELEMDDAGADSEGEDAYSGAEEPSEAENTCNMHPRDLSNFLKLSQAIRLILQDHLEESALSRADLLLREYCSELLELYGPAVIRPNHHYATHTTDFIRWYGPLREFWTFLFERMNKVLKSYRTDNHAGGELECSFLREFFRTVNSSRLLSEASRSTVAGSWLDKAVKQMFKTSSDDRGTLQALSQDLDTAAEDAMATLAFSTRSSLGTLPTDVYFRFLHYLRHSRPSLHFHSAFAVTSDPCSVVVSNEAVVYDYVVVNGKHFYSSSRAPRSAESLIAVFPIGSDAHYRVGELTHAFRVMQAGVGEYLVGHVRWFKSCELQQENTPWAAWYVI